MNWKTKLNIGKFVFNKEIDEYLVGCGFERGEMHPDFGPEKEGSLISYDQPCMHLQIDVEDHPGDIMRIYINRKEFFYEVEGSTGNPKLRSHVLHTKEFKTIRDIDEALNLFI